MTKTDRQKAQKAQTAWMRSAVDAAGSGQALATAVTALPGYTGGIIDRARIHNYLHAKVELSASAATLIEMAVGSDVASAAKLFPVYAGCTFAPAPAADKAAPRPKTRPPKPLREKARAAS